MSSVRAIFFFSFPTLFWDKMEVNGEDAAGLDRKSYFWLRVSESSADVGRELICHP